MAEAEEQRHWAVEDLIPHRGRMRLIDERLAGTDSWVETAGEVRACWPLAAADGVPALLLVELLAQSASLLIGWKRRRIEPQGGTGVLVGVRQANFTCSTVPLGTRLTTRVLVLRTFGSYAVFTGTVHDGEGRLLCDGEIQAFRPEEGQGGGKGTDSGTGTGTAT